MLKKVAINRKEIDKLIKMKKYDEAIKIVDNSRRLINDIAQNRVDKLVEYETILSEEKTTFLSIIENDINNRLLQDSDYILIDESYVKVMKEKFIQLKSIRGKKLMTRI